MLVILVFLIGLTGPPFKALIDPLFWSTEQWINLKVFATLNDSEDFCEPINIGIKLDYKDDQLFNIYDLKI